MKKFEWMLDSENIEMYEKLCAIEKLTRKKLLNKMITMEADWLISDGFVNDDLLLSWLKKHEKLLLVK